MTYQIESLKKLSKLELSSVDRLARIIKKGEKSRLAESVGTIVPKVHISLLNILMNDDVGQEYLRGCVENVQDAIIRKLAEAGKMALFDDQIGIAALLDAMRASNESMRFSKEAIKVWFEENLQGILCEKIEEKNPGISKDKMLRMVTAYLESFQVLAGRNPSMDEKVKAGLLRAMEFLPDDHESAVAIEIVERLQAVKKPEAMLEML